MKRLIGLPALLVACVLAISAPVAQGADRDGIKTFYKSVNPLAMSDCPSATGPTWESYMCAWQGNEYGGALSYWPQGNTGCHNHAGNPNLRSFWNRTPYNVRIGGWGVLGPGYGLQMPANEPITGELCWPA